MSEKKDLTIEAQNYSLKHKLKNFTPAGVRRSVSEFGSSKYKERMDVLREADDEMRSTAILFKDYLKSAEKAFKDNRYLDVAHWCAMVNDGVKLMMKDAKSVVDLRDAEIAEYYTRHEDASPETNYFSADDGLVSTAGLMNRLFGNSIEKLYWKKIRESKLAVQSLVSKTEQLVAITYSSLDRMGTARAQGNIGSWIEDLQRIGKAQGTFQIFAKGVYDKHLKQLADIVKANKPVSAPVSESVETSAPSQNSPKAIPESDTANEAEELVDEEPVFNLTNKKEPVKEEPAKIEPIKEEKFEKGRPALNDPRNVKKDNDKQLDQLDRWNKLQNLLKGNEVVKAPEIKASPVVEPEVIAPVEDPKVDAVKIPDVIKPPDVVKAPEITSIPKPEVKVETPKVIEQNIPKAVQSPKPIEQPKIVQPDVVAPQARKVPEIPKAPEQATVETAPKRSVGRPRIHQIDPNKVKKNTSAPTVEESVQPSIQAPVDNPFSTAPAPVVPSVSTAPVKEDPVHVDIKGKNTNPEPDKSEIPSKDKFKGNHELDEKWKELDKLDDKWDYTPFLNELRRQINHGKIQKPNPTTGGKMTLVLLPTIKPDNLDVVQDRLMKELGHSVRFVTKENGANIAKDYIAAGWDVQPMLYEEAKKIEEVNNKNPLELLDDPNFLASLPRLGNGEFNQQKLLNDEGEVLSGGKLVSAPTKYPDFQNLDPKMRKAVVNKLLELEKDPKNIIIPEKKAPKSDKPGVVTIPEVSKPEVVSPKVEEKATEIKTPEVKAPSQKSFEDEISEMPSDEENDMKIYEHGDVLEKLLGKPVSEITNGDVMYNLIGMGEYWDSLPKLKNGKFDYDLISKFPEFKVLKDKKQFLLTLGEFEKGKGAKPKYKAANVEDILVKRAHVAFFNELKKIAAIQDVGLMAAVMCKYSEEIEEIDPKMSIQLLQQAEKLLA